MKKMVATISIALAGMAAISFAYAFRLRVERHGLDLQMEAARQQLEALGGALKKSEEAALEARRASVASSNRVGAAETRLQDESRTHDPLRRQIESLHADALRLQAAAETRAGEIKRLQSEVDRREAENRKIEDRRAQAERALTDVQHRRDAAEAEATRAAKDRDAQKTRADELEREVARLRHEIAAVKNDQSANDLAQRQLRDQLAAEQREAKDARLQIERLDKELADARKRADQLQKELDARDRRIREMSQGSKD